MMDLDELLKKERKREKDEQIEAPGEEPVVRAYMIYFPPHVCVCVCVLCVCVCMCVRDLKCTLYYNFIQSVFLRPVKKVNSLENCCHTKQSWTTLMTICRYFSLLQPNLLNKYTLTDDLTPAIAATLYACFHIFNSIPDTV